MKKRFQKLLAEYGVIAVTIHLSVLLISMVGFAIVLSAGVEIGGVGSGIGVIGGAYLATQLIKPFRYAGTAVLTPIVARVLRRKPASAPTAAADRPRTPLP